MTKESLEYSRISERRCQDSLTTTGCANGALLSNCDKESLTIKPELVKFESPPDSSDYGPIKIAYHEEANQNVGAVMLRIGQDCESDIQNKLSKDYKAAYISSKLSADNDLFARKYVSVTSLCKCDILT